MMVLKEKKEMDDCFKKAQKPWVKILNKVDKAKLDYHNACKAERSASNQERNATGDNAVSPEQVSWLWFDFLALSGGGGGLDSAVRDRNPSRLFIMLQHSILYWIDEEKERK